MKRYLALLILTFITVLSFGQGEFQDVIYAKDGSVIRGTIVKQVPDNYIRIETPDGKNFIFQMYEIEKVTKEPFQLVESEDSRENTGLQPGFKEIVEIAYKVDAGEYSIDGKEVDFISVYQFNPYFSAGVGMGLRYYPDMLTTLVPVFGDFRVYFRNKIFTPYLVFGAGFSYNASENWAKVGRLLNSAVGVSIKVTEEFAINAGVGLTFQNIDSYFGGYSTDADAVSLTLGISF